MGFEDYMKSHVTPFGVLILELGQYCPVECAHCHVESDKTTREKLSESMLKSAIQDFSNLPNAEYAYITGGEPFVYRRLLSIAANTARESGLKSFALTSAFWAQTSKSLKATLEKMPAIDLVGISYDQYHAPRVALSSIISAAQELRNRGTDVFIALGSFGPDDTFRRDAMLKMCELGGSDIQIVHYPLLARGKGAGLPELDGLELSRSSVGGCRSIGAPVLTATGRICACCHTNAANAARKGILDPLTISDCGNVNEAATTFLKSKLVRALRSLGPEALLEAINPPQPSVIRKSRDICTACDELRSATNWGRIEDFLNSSRYPEARIQAIELAHEDSTMSKFRAHFK